MRILKLFTMVFAVLALVSTGFYGCAGKQEAGDEGMATTQPADEGMGAGGRESVEAPPASGEGAEPVEPARPELALKDVYFDFDKFDIKPSQVAALEGNAKWLKDNPSAVATIEGHCDERGTVEYNLALGERRSDSARDYLVTLGVDSSRLKTISYGKSKPADPGHDEAAWAKNRRAHFVVQ